MEAKNIMAKTNKVATVHHYKKYTTLEALKQPSSIVYCSKEKYLHLTVLPVNRVDCGISCNVSYRHEADNSEVPNPAQYI